MEKIKEPSGKYRVYTGFIVCSQNYALLNQHERSFWQKAYKSFRKGDLHFMHNGKQYVVPFKLADGSFDSVEVTEKLKESVKKVKEEQNVKNERASDSGQGEPADTLVAGTE